MPKDVEDDGREREPLFTTPLQYLNHIFRNKFQSKIYILVFLLPSPHPFHCMTIWAEAWVPDGGQRRDEDCVIIEHISLQWDDEIKN